MNRWLLWLSGLGSLIACLIVGAWISGSPNARPADPLAIQPWPPSQIYARNDTTFLMSRGQMFYIAPSWSPCRGAKR